MASRPVVLLSLAIVLWCGAAGAVQHVRSLYTAIDLRRCELTHGPGEAHRCGGLPGYPVLVAQDADGAYLSIGQNAERHQAARQTLKAFNTLFHDGSQRSTVEWRFVVRDKRTIPYATIVRYFTHSKTGSGEVLVVTRIAPGEVCHVAYIDALATSDAIKLARRVADTIARKNGCPPEPEILGAQGQSPM